VRFPSPALVISESDFQVSVVALAAWQGWRVYHTHDSRHSPSGYPDLTLVREERLIFAELKREDEDATPEQQEWLDDLEATGQAETYLWKPSSWDSLMVTLARPQHTKRSNIRG